MKEELCNFLEISDSGYYNWKNKIHKPVINFFNKYFTKKDIEELNTKKKIAKLEYMYCSSTISLFQFYALIKIEILNKELRNSLIRFFLMYKKNADFNDLGGTIPIDLDFNLKAIEQKKTNFYITVMNFQKDMNIHHNYKDFMFQIENISIQNYIFLHYLIINNFNLMIELLEHDTFRLNPENEEISENLYMFLIDYYGHLYNLDIEEFKGKKYKTKFNLLLKDINQKYPSNNLFDILDITRAEKL